MFHKTGKKINAATLVAIMLFSIVVIGIASDGATANENSLPIYTSAQNGQIIDTQDGIDSVLITYKVSELEEMLFSAVPLYGQTVYEIAERLPFAEDTSDEFAGKYLDGNWSLLGVVNTVRPDAAPDYEASVAYLVTNNGLEGLEFIFITNPEEVFQVHIDTSGTTATAQATLTEYSEELSEDSEEAPEQVPVVPVEIPSSDPEPTKEAEQQSASKPAKAPATNPVNKPAQTPEQTPEKTLEQEPVNEPEQTQEDTTTEAQPELPAEVTTTIPEEVPTVIIQEETPEEVQTAPGADLTEAETSQIEAAPPAVIDELPAAPPSEISFADSTSAGVIRAQSPLYFEKAETAVRLHNATETDLDGYSLILVTKTGEVDPGDFEMDPDNYVATMELVIKLQVGLGAFETNRPSFTSMYDGRIWTYKTVVPASGDLLKITLYAWGKDFGEEFNNNDSFRPLQEGSALTITDVIGDDYTLVPDSITAIQGSTAIATDVNGHAGVIWTVNNDTTDFAIEIPPEYLSNPGFYLSDRIDPAQVTYLVKLNDNVPEGKYNTGNIGDPDTVGNATVTFVPRYTTDTGDVNKYYYISYENIDPCYATYSKVWNDTTKTITIIDSLLGSDSIVLNMAGFNVNPDGNLTKTWPEFPINGDTYTINVSVDTVFDEATITIIGFYEFGIDLEYRVSVSSNNHISAKRIGAFKKNTSNGKIIIWSEIELNTVIDTVNSSGYTQVGKPITVYKVDSASGVKLPNVKFTLTPTDKLRFSTYTDLNGSFSIPLKIDDKFIFGEFELNEKVSLFGYTGLDKSLPIKITLVDDNGEIRDYNNNDGTDGYMPVINVRGGGTSSKGASGWNYLDYEILEPVYGKDNKYLGGKVLIIYNTRTPASITVTKKLVDDSKIYETAHGESTFLFTVEKLGSAGETLKTWVEPLTFSAGEEADTKKWRLDDLEWGYKYRVTELNTMRYDPVSISGSDELFEDGGIDSVIVNLTDPNNLTSTVDDEGNERYEAFVNFTNTKINDEYLSDSYFVVNKFNYQPQP